MKRLNRKSLFYRIWLSGLITGMVPLILVNIIWFHNTDNIAYSSRIDAVATALSELNMRIENIVNYVNMNSYTFLFDEEIKTMLSSPPKSEEERLKTESCVQELFAKIKKNNTMICSLEFVGNYYNISSESASRGEVDFEELKSYVWFQNIKKYHESYFTPVYNNRYIEGLNTKVFGWMRQIPGADTGGNRTIGHLLIEISWPNLKNVVEKVEHLLNASVVIINQEQDIIFCSQEFTKEGLAKALSGLNEEGGPENREQDFRWQDTDYVAVSEKVGTTGWNLFILLDKQHLTALARQSLKQCMVIGIGLVIFSFLIALFLSRRISRPIYQLAETMKQVEENQMDLTVPEQSGIDEVDGLARGFNHMLGHIRALIRDIRKEEQEKNKIEMQMLQAQINPHFLYNTLNVIRWKAVIDGEKTISNMLLSLIKLLEFSGKKTGTYVRVAKELEHATSYLELMRYRYQDNFEAVYEIDPRAKECYVVKFVLQPLVENAVLHGLEPMEEKGIVKIGVRLLEGRLYFSVEDNGVGMSEEVYQNSSAFRGLGLYNTNERLKRYYGEACRLQIESGQKRGTRVSFSIPASTEDPGEE